MGRVRASLGLMRSVLIYYGVPGRARSLARHYRPFVPAGGLCIDVGAHVGNRVRAWRRLGARVVAIEPQQACVRLLRRLYGHDPGVVLLPVALGASAGEGELLVSEAHPTVSTTSARWTELVARDPRFAAVTWNAREAVSVTTLDRVVERFGAPDFIKIDVEGAEPEVLAGLSAPVKALSFEVVPAARAAALACLERLQALGDYAYNWSSGEDLRLESPRWVGPAEVSAWLRGLPAGARSGDVYARLRGSTPVQ